jgi:hypothetical protein
VCINNHATPTDLCIQITFIKRGMRSSSNASCCHIS